ncbi:MAG TPA: response regulator [Ramlibacter sp.]|nr:response regulator [Ramlibacter sp.]
MNFPLFHRPGSVVFLDDDPDYLEMLALVLPRHWHVRLFLHPEDCIAHLNREPPFWEADAWAQQEIIQHWHAGRPLVPQILDYWSRSTERYALTRVCVFDYSMPAMDGLQALSRLQDWPGSRVLLTGQADEQIAVQAFNRRLIDQFIAKQTPEISRRLIGAVEQLLSTPHPRHAQTWRATLSPTQNTWLREPSVGRDLLAFAGKHWVEHVLLGAPFGVLGLDASGRASWLQLEGREGLQAQAELAEVEGLPAADRTAIREGRQLSNLELRQALGKVVAPQLAPSFTLGEQRALHGALFEIESPPAAGGTGGYTRWLARQERRRVLG